ncbi:MAG: hypothetical protein ABJ273_06905, partial [Marinobacter alexandrii]|uniref:hypothetical protein n=1 Tax=Marinobacter alexandrii TaxID=2570351 RepID=UPI003296B080
MSQCIRQNPGLGSLARNNPDSRQSNQPSGGIARTMVGPKPRYQKPGTADLENPLYYLENMETVVAWVRD